MECPSPNPLPQAPSPTQEQVRAALPRLDRHRPRGGPMRRSKVGKWRAAVLIAVHVAIGLHLWHWLSTGSTLSPVEPSEAMQTLETGKVNAGFLLFVVMVGSTLLFGRWLCGWACHLVAVQDLCAYVLGRFGLRPRPVRSRLLVFAPFVVAFYMFAWPQVVRWWQALVGEAPPRPDLEWALTTTDFWRTFPGPIMSVASYLVVGILIVWWLGAKGFCSFGCPYGGVFAVVDRFASLRIRKNERCSGCGHCTHACSSNVRVHEEVAKHGMVVDPGCMKCLDCVSVCPQDALRVGFGPIHPFRTSQQRLQVRADFTWPEEIALLLLVLLGYFAVHNSWFGEHVGFLLSVGTAVIAGVLGLLGWRLLRRPAVTFQHTELKRDGRLRPAGWWAVGAIAAFWLLAVDLAAVNACSAVADWLSPQVAPREAAQQRAADLRRVDGWWCRAAALAPFDNPLLRQRRGLVLRELAVTERDPALLARAEAELQAAVAIRPTWAPAVLPLTDVLLQRGAFAEIETLLQRLLAAEPGNRDAAFRLQRLQERKAGK